VLYKSGMHDLALGVSKAIQAFGTRTALAEALGIQRSAISQWKRVPVERVLEIEKLTKSAVSRSDMRPDVYPPEAA
jgi:DNA-binding transcriptional regulator YdaS (Cro superfamily)